MDGAGVKEALEFAAIETFDLRPAGHGRFDYEREDRIAAAWRKSYDALTAELDESEA